MGTNREDDKVGRDIRTNYIIKSHDYIKRNNTRGKRKYELAAGLNHERKESSRKGRKLLVTKSKKFKGKTNCA